MQLLFSVPGPVSDRLVFVAVAVLKPRALSLETPLQDSELMAKSHDLRLQCPVCFEAGAE